MSVPGFASSMAVVEAFGPILLDVYAAEDLLMRVFFFDNGKERFSFYLGSLVRTKTMVDVEFTMLCNYCSS